MQGCLRYVIKMLGDRLLNYILFDFYKDFLDLCLVVYLADVTDKPFLFGFLEFLLSRLFSCFLDKHYFKLGFLDLFYFGLGGFLTSSAE